MKLLIALFLFTTSTSFAAIFPQTKEVFCERFDNKTAVKELSTTKENLLSFKNQGGIFDGGVCWWHSRFQRNLLYLAIFHPEKKRDQNPQQLINQIRLAREIVHINGFKNVEEFSQVYKKQIITELENWQLYEGVVLSAWIQGLKGNHSIAPQEMLTRMNALYSYVANNHKIAYQKLQIKGITAHAWLVTDIKKTNYGYVLGVIDSNRPNQSMMYTYTIGDRSFSSKSYGSFVPYLEFTREEERLVTIAKKYCNRSFSALQLEEDQILYNEDLDLREHDQIHEDFKLPY